MANISEIVSQLEELEAEDAHPSRMLEVLTAIQSSMELWEVAERVAPYLPIARMIFRRSMQLGASLDRSRGYLALAYIFDGDDETASAIVGDPQESADPVLLSAWAHLAEGFESERRLHLAIDRCPTDARLRRQLEDLLDRRSHSP